MLSYVDDDLKNGHRARAQGAGAGDQGSSFRLVIELDIILRQPLGSCCKAKSLRVFPVEELALSDTIYLASLDGAWVWCGKCLSVSGPRASRTPDVSFLVLKCP